MGVLGDSRERLSCVDMGLVIAEGVVDGEFKEFWVGGVGVEDGAAVGGLVADSLAVVLVPYDGAFLGVDEYVLAVVGMDEVAGFVHFLGILRGVCFHDCFNFLQPRTAAVTVVVWMGGRVSGRGRGRA